METQTTQLKTWETFLIYLFLCVMTVTSVVILMFYFSKVFPSFTKTQRFETGFEIGFVVALVLALIGTWRAIRTPSPEEEEDEEEVEDEEE